MNMKYGYVKKWRYRAKYRVVQAFGGCCGICGYNKCIFALEFHHLDLSKKEIRSFIGS